MVVVFRRDAMGKCIRTIITIVVLAVAIAFAIPVQAHAATSNYMTVVLGI